MNHHVEDGSDADGSEAGIRRRGFLTGSVGIAAGTAVALGSAMAANADTPAPDPGGPTLGAAAPSLKQAAKGRASRIGIGYETWFDAVGWSRPEAEPVLGHYSSLDEKVIRQHLQWLTWAGFDHLWVDWSNNLGGNWTSGTAEKIMAGTDKLLEVLSQTRNPPQIYLLLGLDNGQAGTDNFNAQVDRIKTKYLGNKKYSKLYVQHDGKPLLSIYTGARTTLPPEWNDDDFTVRWVGAFREIVLNPGGTWSWVDRVGYANGPTTAVAPFTKDSWNGWQADGGWKVETLAAQPAFNVTVNTDVAWNNPGNGAQAKGSLTSPAFTITENTIAFNVVGFDMSAGSDLTSLDGRNVFVLKDAASGDILRHDVPPGDSTRLYVRQWNVADLKGRSVVFSAVSNSGMGGGLGWLGFDGVVQQRAEQMTACVANAGNEGPGSFANWDAHSRDSGAYLVEMMANAFEYEPEILTVQQWNEFGRPDQYSIPGSNDIEPTKVTKLAGRDSDGYGYYYLKLVRELIAQYRKGDSFPHVQLDTRYP